MVKMYLSGITLEVPEKEVDLYKRAGYSVVVEEPAPVEPVASEETKEPAPVEKKSKK